MANAHNIRAEAQVLQLAGQALPEECWLPDLYREASPGPSRNGSNRINWNTRETPQQYLKGIGCGADSYITGEGPALLNRIEAAYYHACVTRKLLGLPNPHEKDWDQTGGRLPSGARDYLLLNGHYYSYEKDTGIASPFNIVFAANPLLTDICCSPLIGNQSGAGDERWPSLHGN